MDNPYRQIPYDLFHRYWQCSIPESCFQSVEQLRTYGKISSGNKKVDQVLLTQERECYMTIPKLLYFFEDGASIRFSKPMDIVDVYKLITGHIDNWVTILKTEYNVKSPPIEDFRLMDSFASAIHVPAQCMERTPGAVALLPKTQLRFTRRRLGSATTALKYIPDGTIKPYVSRFRELVKILGR